MTATKVGAADKNLKSNSENRRASKPLMEKRRRARINQSLSILKTLIVDSTRVEGQKHSKLEKADILELTVTHLQTLKKSDEQKFIEGFEECSREAVKFLEKAKINRNTIEKMLGHLKTFQQSQNFSEKEKRDEEEKKESTCGSNSTAGLGIAEDSVGSNSNSNSTATTTLTLPTLMPGNSTSPPTTSLQLSQYSSSLVDSKFDISTFNGSPSSASSSACPSPNDSNNNSLAEMVGGLGSGSGGGMQVIRRLELGSGQVVYIVPASAANNVHVSSSSNNIINNDSSSVIPIASATGSGGAFTPHGQLIPLSGPHPHHHHQVPHPQQHLHPHHPSMLNMMDIDEENNCSAMNLSTNSSPINNINVNLISIKEESMFSDSEPLDYSKPLDLCKNSQHRLVPDDGVWRPW